jgi:FdhD protein
VRVVTPTPADGVTGVSSDAVRQSTTMARVTTVRDQAVRERVDTLATEEPMEIRAAGPGQEPVRVAVTMRTPGNDFELAAGFLVTEGLVASDEVAAVAYCEDPDAQRYNVVTVRTATPFDLGAAERNFFATSSCGICGKAALEAVGVRCPPILTELRVRASALLGLPSTLRDRQRIFGRTGGLHAAGLFDATGRLHLLREDVGRHNAVDKVVGALTLGEVGDAKILVVSGRLSFEIVQKAAVARIPVVCAISAPSSLAVSAADELGVTAVGFLRPGGFNVYSHADRVLTGASG